MVLSAPLFPACSCPAPMHLLILPLRQPLFGWLTKQRTRQQRRRRLCRSTQRGRGCAGGVHPAQRCQPVGSWELPQHVLRVPRSGGAPAAPAQGPQGGPAASPLERGCGRRRCRGGRGGGWGRGAGEGQERGQQRQLLEQRRGTGQGRPERAGSRGCAERPGRLILAPVPAHLAVPEDVVERGGQRGAQRELLAPGGTPWVRHLWGRRHGRVSHQGGTLIGLGRASRFPMALEAWRTSAPCPLAAIPCPVIVRMRSRTKDVDAPCCCLCLVALLVTVRPSHSDLHLFLAFPPQTHSPRLGPVPVFYLCPLHSTPPNLSL